MGHTDADGLNVPQWTLGDRIRKARATAGMTQGNLAALIGAGRATIQNWERDKTPPPYYALMALAAATKTPLAWLNDEATR